MNKIYIILLSLIFIAAACNRSPVSLTQDNKSQSSQINESISQTHKTVEFAGINSIFRFSGQIPSNWQIEYVAETEALNIYNPVDAAAQALEKSQIFIRHFTANSFLTLSTVDILSRQESSVGTHAAVKYEIKKKLGVANFANQPAWRSNQHKLIDIRFSTSNPSQFFVFAHNPDLDPAVFDKFIADLVFHNDKQSLKQPIDAADKRITKKPFGIKISPQNSPVQPERFSGYHTAVDYEILPGEEDSEVMVFAVCGGKLLQVKSADGYGGVAVQECEIENQKITVIYGHIDQKSVSNKIGDYLVPGQQLANLGQDKTSETDGQRKHLHLGVHKGTGIDIRGYVNDAGELQNWIDFQNLQK